MLCIISMDGSAHCAGEQFRLLLGIPFLINCYGFHAAMDAE